RPARKKLRIPFLFATTVLISPDISAAGRAVLPGLLRDSNGIRKLDQAGGYLRYRTRCHRRYANAAEPVQRSASASSGKLVAGRIADGSAALPCCPDPR